MLKIPFPDFRFSDVFMGYRSGTLVENGLNREAFLVIREFSWLPIVNIMLKNKRFLFLLLQYTASESLKICLCNSTKRFQLRLLLHKLNTITTLDVTYRSKYLPFKVDNRNTREECETSSKLTTKTLARGYQCPSGVFIVSFHNLFSVSIVYLEMEIFSTVAKLSKRPKFIIAWYAPNTETICIPGGKKY